jgi:GNAT superfamily N-acetyltransferase
MMADAVFESKGVLRFSGISEAPAGTLSALLVEAYAPLLASGIGQWASEVGKWEEFDRLAYADPRVARCVFLTWEGDTLAGFASFDPREAPASVRVGHHCLRPALQRRGIGRLQFRELLRRIEVFRPAELTATTLDLPFFAPARRLYETEGFELADLTPWGMNPAARVVRFHKRCARSAPS